MSPRPKFLTDATLAKLAKWLRILSYDTSVYPKEAGRAMLRLAQAEDRIVLTRRGDMIERQFSGRLHLLKQTDVAAQLQEIIEKYSLQPEKEKLFGLCLKCNEILHPIEVEKARDLVPAYVYQHCKIFNQCPVCQNIYWEGTHQRNSLRFLQKNKITIS
ncbi:MAG TPA: hypothetical protein ENN95_01325 [Deltaproteobacteria bacterium]|nr:hypothetical protein [Deltaproteobacteria bacterium]